MSKTSGPMPADPDAVPEVLCTGATNLLVMGTLAVLTFTHVRKKTAHTFGEFNDDTTESVVRARVAMPIEALMALKTLIDRTIKVEPVSPGSNARN